MIMMISGSAARSEARGIDIVAGILCRMVRLDL